MKSNVLTIMKKELFRFLSDRRTLFGAILLPGLMIYIIYNFMGSAISDSIVQEDVKPQIGAVNMPASVKTILDMQKVEFVTIEKSQTEIVELKKNQIEQKSFDLLVVFPGNFDTLVAEYDIAKGGVAPNVDIFFNSSNAVSTRAYALIGAVLDSYEAALSNKFDVNNTQVKYDLANEKDISAMIFSSMMPMLITIFLFSGVMAVAPESIAGEKERGTLSTLLVTPLKRSELALGKILAVSAIALLGATSSTLGTLLSLPKLKGGMDDIGVYYTTTDYVLLALIIFCTVLLFVSIVSIVSAYAKSIKEAQTYVAPMMIVVTLAGVSGMLGSTADSPFLYLIPVYNSVQCLSSIFSFGVQQINVIITVVSNIVYCGIFAFVLTRMFNSEKVMFSR